MAILEISCSMKVVAATSIGASKCTEKLTERVIRLYRAQNLYAEDKIYIFFSDPAETKKSIGREKNPCSEKPKLNGS